MGLNLFSSKMGADPDVAGQLHHAAVGFSVALVGFPWLGHFSSCTISVRTGLLSDLHALS